MLLLNTEVRDGILKHAFDENPNEACGLFAAEKGTSEVHTFFPMRNVAESSVIYQLDPLEMMKVESEADTNNVQIIGVMHSHTHTPAYPSSTDVRDAATFDPLGLWHYLIVSLEKETPSIRSFRIKDGEISEEEVRVI
ncbi:MAG TPA: M67 family metallopeptidase [Acidimicrobiales bacterium]|jgi:proteasome lid subunit RPN8/RPN11|nr:M67 family metallopeptidase [Acidimicrobiales bacterium]HJM28449.1 M67 family metallopeptidase [Acidimicrobiales bacterium]HJM96976.1 M67 family metallopeptidase [Acidimicrobiales bacterium]